MVQFFVFFLCEWEKEIKKRGRWNSMDVNHKAIKGNRLFFRYKYRFNVVVIQSSFSVSPVSSGDLHTTSGLEPC